MNIVNISLEEWEFLINKKISVISIALDALQNTIAALAGKLGNIHGVSVKTAYSNVISHD